MFYKFLLTGILAVCAYANVVTSSLNDDYDAMLVQQKFALKLIKRTYSNRMETRGVDKDNECFNYYFTQQDTITRVYNEQYRGCKSTAQEARKQMTKQSSEKREETIVRGNAICGDLSTCTVIEDGFDFFNCYSDASNAHYRTLYNLHVESSAQVTNLEVFYQRIEIDERNCTTLARNEYISALAVCNTDLDRCLNGSPLPNDTTQTPEPTTTKAPVTTTPEITQASSEQPETPTSQEPETTTTLEPEGTTDEQLPEEDLFSFKSGFSLMNWLRRLRA